ncbi:MAG: diaminopimelate epimerase [Sphingobacteriales bacterium]|nr:MAG: diaminopimelate epimerase [Sphingobacteriales bacterium]
MIPFHKYHGTGNDFILIDNRNGQHQMTTAQIRALCHRHFGIGADGLMLLENEAGYDFRMVYFNSDGNESSMCGNGGRCIAAFARYLGIGASELRFLAVDGPHEASFVSGEVSLAMSDVTEISTYPDHTILDTGSPHYVLFKDDATSIDVVRLGRSIRNEARFQDKGINVNFVHKTMEGIFVRTYERGVEDETLSCGTGVTAAAIAMAGNATGRFHIPVETPGGRLSVKFYKPTPDAATEIFLTGPAVRVFEGEVLV